MKFQMFLNKTKVVNELDNIKSNGFVLSDYQKELFKVSLDEKSELPKVDKKILDIAMKFLTKKFDVSDDELKYIGYTDLSFIKKGSKLLQFNILKKGHPKFNSTVAYKYEG